MNLTDAPAPGMRKCGLHYRINMGAVLSRGRGTGREEAVSSYNQLSPANMHRKNRVYMRRRDCDLLCTIQPGCASLPLLAPAIAVAIAVSHRRYFYPLRSSLSVVLHRCCYTQIKPFCPRLPAACLSICLSMSIYTSIGGRHRECIDMEEALRVPRWAG